MLNSGKKINILTLLLSEKKIQNETKNHNPPFKLNGRSLSQDLYFSQIIFVLNEFRGEEVIGFVGYSSLT
jgi:hypothetical protein